MSAVERTLVQALLTRAGAHAALVGVAALPWASITFEGHRRRIELTLPTARAAAFADGLDEVDWPLPGHILADLAVEERVDDGAGGTRLIVGALTLAAG